MERGFYQEDLEQLLKQKADQYKMYPSDKVWKGVYRSLHTRRKWYWFSFVLFISALSYYAIVELIAPSSGKTVTDNAAAAPEQQPASQQKATIIPFNNFGKPANSNSDKTGPQNSFIINPDKADAGIARSIAEPVAGIGEGVIAAAKEYAPVFDIRTGKLKEHGHNEATTAATIVISESTPFTFQTPAIESIVAQDITPLVKATQGMLHEEEINGEDALRINWLQEYAVYDLAPPKMKRLSWQLSFSPTMNYRKLTGNDNAYIPSDIKNIPIALNISGDPDKLLNHKPAIGFELGSHFLYALNKDFLIKAGVQFNYSRYYIQAYSSSTERATIALNSVGAGSNSLTSYTHLRNFGGDAVEDLQNQYFQLSAPVGLEMRLLGNGKIQLNVAGTIQPTYLLNRNTYLITTDYKNYTQEPSLVRRWNINTGAEAFVSYKTGDLKWQVGPQFRYQLLSSYISEYPIREHLMEYGIKIGVTKTIR